jgi:hypothetical protein
MFLVYLLFFPTENGKKWEKMKNTRALNGYSEPARLCCVL